MNITERNGAALAGVPSGEAVVPGEDGAGILLVEDVWMSNDEYSEKLMASDETTIYYQLK